MAAIIFVIVGSTFVVIVGREKPTAVQTSDAIGRYRNTDSGGVTGTSTTDVISGLRPPSPGVYLYRGEGTEVVTLPPITDQQGPDMPATVTLDGDGCWTLKIDLNTHHWQDWKYCVGPEGMFNTSGHTYTLHDFAAVKIEALATFTCEPRMPLLWTGMRPGERRPGSCASTNDKVAGTTVLTGDAIYVGDEEIEIGDTKRPTRHIRFEHTMAGPQRGTENTDTWLDAETGLPLRNRHVVVLDTDSPIGNIHYTETGSFELTSLQPAT